MYFVWSHLDPLTLSGGWLVVLLVGAGALLLGFVFLQWLYRRQKAYFRAQLWRESAFSNFGSKLGAAADPKAAARVVADTAQELVGWDAFTLGLLDDNGKQWSVLDMDTVDGKKTEIDTPVAEASPMMKKVLADGAQLILRQSGDEWAGTVVPFGNTGRRSASLLFVPIRHGPKNVGMISVQSYRPNAYGQKDRDALQYLADHCAGTLERIRAQDLLRQAHDQLEERIKERTFSLMATNSLLQEKIEEQDRTEKALAREQHLLRALMDNIPDYIYFKDSQGRFTRVNTALGNRFGKCDPEGMVGKTDFDFFAPEAARQSFEDEQRIMQTGMSLVAKEEHEQWLDGTDWWALTTKLPFRDADGKIAGTFGITRDITPRKKAEEALKQAQEELEQRVKERTAELTESNARLVSEIAERKEAEARSTAFSRLGFQLAQARARDKAAEIMLETADQLLGWDAAYLHLYTPDHKKIIPVLCYDQVEGRRMRIVDYLEDDTLSFRDRKVIADGPELLLRRAPDECASNALRFGDRERPALSLMYVPIRRGTQVLGILSVQSYTPGAYEPKDLETLQTLADFCFGTLERIGAEEDYRQSEERFAKAFLSSPVAMALSRISDGRYLDVNERMVQLVGFRREEMVGRTSLELGLWPKPAEFIKLAEHLAQHRSVRDLECNLRSKTGALRAVLISAEVIDFKGEPTMLAGVYDVTERLNLEEQLRHSQKMEAVGQLAAGVAHDFNNILTVIQGHVTLCLSAPDITEALTDSLKQVGLCADRAANLTRQLLTFSRRQIMQPRTLDLNEIINNLHKMIQRLVGEHISLHFNYSPVLPAVHADAGMLEQVLINLAVNARDAMPQGGKLIVSTETAVFDEQFVRQNPNARSGQFVCLAVSDTGTGIDPGVLPRIFEPFFTTKEVGKGTGLGLATVYGIVKQHQGWVEVSSEPERGSTFKVFLPATAKAKPEEVQAPSPAAGGGKETILLVEDETPLRELMRGVLKLYGYRVIEAAHGKEAQALWRKHRDEIHLLLTDLVMPEGISGLELADQFKKEKPELKALYTSGYCVEIFSQRHLLNEGVNFLPKPFQPKTLAKTVRACLEG